MNCGVCNHKLVAFCPSCRAKKSSPKRVQTARANGKKGGRPPKTLGLGTFLKPAEERLERFFVRKYAGIVPGFFQLRL